MFEPNPSTSKTSSKSEDFFKVKTDVSAVKHAVLKRYLGEWFAKLSRNPYKRYSKIVYVDGFSGPGIYDNGDPGSPAIVYELALTHTGLLPLRAGGPLIYLVFVEIDPKRCQKLFENLTGLKEAHKRSVNADVVNFLVINGSFENAMRWLLWDEFSFPQDASTRIYNAPQEISYRREAPSLYRFICAVTPLMVFADPFGYSGDLIPMELMRDILACSSSAELFINLMTGHIRRFFGIDNRTRPINKLMGDSETDASWKNVVLDGSDSKEKLELFLWFYKASLSNGCFGTLHTSLFEMRDYRNILKYHLFYATQHEKGFTAIKNAMRKESLNEMRFTFSEFEARKPEFKPTVVSVDQLTEWIKDEFKGRVVSGEEITRWLERHETLTQHFKRELKKSLKDFHVPNEGEQPGVGRFDEMLFDFRRV